MINSTMQTLINALAFIIFKQKDQFIIFIIFTASECLSS
jgi:hypothetical protein